MYTKDRNMTTDFRWKRNALINTHTKKKTSLLKLFHVQLYYF